MADWKRGLRRVLYPAYESRMLRRMPAAVPQHVGVMLDGNRRWARAVGRDSEHGHEAGAANIEPLLGWCDEVGIEVVTLWLLSTDNLNRPEGELVPLLRIIEDAVAALAGPAALAGAPGGRPRPAAGGHGASGSRRPRRPPATSTACSSTSPSATAAAARSPTPSARCSRSTPSRGTTLEELAAILDVEHIADHLYTKGQPDPDLVIRTSGEQRLGGFLLWQSARSEFYFCEAYWPDFRKVDFLRAIRAYAERERRFGT